MSITISKTYVQWLGAIIFSIILSLPTVMHINHYLEGHEHFACNDSTTHYHEKTSDCDNCHLQLENFNCDFSTDNEIDEVKIPTVVLVYTSNFINTSGTNKVQLRGPPAKLS